MRAMISSFFIVLVFSCLLFSLLEQPAPYPMPVGIGTVRESGFGLTRGEGSIPEIHLSDTARGVGYMTKIDEGSNERNVEFPLGANN